MRRNLPVSNAMPFCQLFRLSGSAFRQGFQYLILVASLLFGNLEVIAQVFPADSDTLYQTEIMFSVTPLVNVVSYKFSIGEEIVKEEKTSASLVKGLQFGKHYNWKVDIKLTDSSVKTENHHFYIAERTYSDPSLVRFRTIESHKVPGAYDEGLIMLDFGSVAINRSGEVVWFLNRTSPQLRDMYSRPMILNQNGNIMLTSSFGAVECDLAGKVLWHSPQQLPIKLENPNNYLHRFHHDIQKLSGGRYLTLVKYYPRRLLPGIKDSVGTENDAVLIFDSLNNLKWSWLLGDKLSLNEMSKRFSSIRAHGETTLPVGEINSAYLDENKKLLYLGIRDFNCLLVVEYPSGRMLRTYGQKLDHAEKNFLPGSMKDQHGGVPDQEGNLWVFNNNGEIDEQKMSELIAIKEPRSKNDTAELIWKFSCAIDELSSGKTQRLGFASPLRNGNVLACMGFTGRIFEVTRDKQIVWDCLAETMPSITSANSDWNPKSNYRAHFYPSLYPNYFSTQTYSTGNNYQILVENKGFNDDSYSLYLRNNKNKRTLIGTVSIKTGKSGMLNYLSSKGFKSGKDILELESLNTGAIRIIYP